MNLYILVHCNTLRLRRLLRADMLLKFLIVSVAAVIVVSLTWSWASGVAERRRLDRWVKSERTRRFAKKKAKKVQEAVDVLYNEIEGNEEEQ